MTERNRAASCIACGGITTNASMDIGNVLESLDDLTGLRAGVAIV
jgi:hypothetical protein